MIVFADSQPLVVVEGLYLVLWFLIQDMPEPISLVRVRSRLEPASGDSCRRRYHPHSRRTYIVALFICMGDSDETSLF